MSVRCIFVGAPRALRSNGERRRNGALYFGMPKSFSEVRDDEGYRLCDPSAECECKITAFFWHGSGLSRMLWGLCPLTSNLRMHTHSMDYLRSHYHSTDAYESPSREFASNLSVKKYTFSKNVNYLHFTCILFSICNLLIIRQL